ncbi:MAG: hypothetical protein ACXVAY_05090 [Mucilaginibacter sp.]
MTKKSNLKFWRLGFLKHRWQKITLVFLLADCIVVLAIGIVANLYFSPIIEEKVKTGILTNTDSLYKVDFSSVKIHVFQRKIVVFDITVKADPAVYARLKKRGLAPNNLLDLYIKRLAITDINPAKLLFKHKLEISQIILSAPEIHITYQRNHTKDTTAKDNRTPWQKIAKTFRSVHVADILLNDVQFRYDDHSGNKVTISELKEMNIHANDLLIDAATQTDQSRFLFCRDMVVELNNYTGKTPSGLYTYTIKYLKLSSLTSRLIASGISLKPTDSVRFFNKTLNDRYSGHLDGVQLNNFDFLNYYKYRVFSVSNMVLDKGSLSVYKNPNRPQLDADRTKTFPGSVLADVKLDLKIDTLLVKHLDISYTEVGQKSKQSGTINFTNTDAQFLNITNNKTALQKNSNCLARVSSDFMGRGELNVLFNFNLTDELAAYSYRGNLGPMDLNVVNPMAMPLGMVKINSGKLKSLDFDFKANSRVATGRVTVLYNDLKVTILKPDSQYVDLQRMRIASLYANIFILKHNNPDREGGIPRSFNVSYVRPVNSPFFNFTWKALFEGIKPGVGFNKKMQETAKALAAQSIIKKQTRKLKKIQRQLRREERRKRREAKNEAEKLKSNTSEIN